MGEHARLLLRFDEVEFDPVELRLHRDGACLDLQPKVSRLLELLCQRAGQLVTKEELTDDLWPESFVNEEALTQLVRKLRKALDDDARSPRYIQTVTTRGYRFLPEVVTVMAAPAPTSGAPVSVPLATPGPVAELSSAPASFPKWPSWRLPSWWRWAAAAALGVTVLGLVAFELATAARQPALRLGRTSSRRLTFSASHKQDPAFAPDGRFVAFVANDPEEGQLDLFMVSTHGGAPMRLTHTPGDEYFPHFSPDGESIACSRFDAARSPSVILVPGLGGEERVLASDATWGCWSPDGRELAFVRRDAGGAWQLVRRVLASGREQVVARAEGEVVSLGWSPDGRELVWSDDRRLLLVPVDGGTPRQVGEAAEYVRSVAWEPTTGRLLTDASWGGRTELWRVDAGSGRREALTSSAGNLFHPTAAADGRRLAYVQESKEMVLLAVDTDGRQPRPLAAKTTLRSIDLDPTGAWLAFTDNEPSHGHGHVGVLPLAGGPARTLSTGEASCPVFSPDGRRVAFIRHDRGGDVLVTVPAGGGEELVVLPGEAGRELGRPAWAPDGQGLTVPAHGGAAGSGLLAAAASGGGPRVLLAGELGPPTWSKDGRWVAASSRTAGSEGLYLVEMTTGVSRRLSGRHSFLAAPIFGPGDTSVLVLEGSRSRPRLVEVGLDGRETGREIVVEHPPEAGFWGIFEALPRPGGGFLCVMERYEADLYLLEAKE
ncbi:MAG: winged helix-turn-helix domain-containing protein [Thermoanaerobaculaceae bacterium]|jgi:Tol biopolymer transport system component/DNA-binding winged helix-turn-helix (wHTH) protein|nr:winged helix-turn-helix domain-containing protein [Thermoanaerobaculaceae bacterium]